MNPPGAWSSHTVSAQGGRSGFRVIGLRLSRRAYKSSIWGSKYTNYTNNGRSNGQEHGK